MNLTYRWFLCLGIDDKVLIHPTITRPIDATARERCPPTNLRGHRVPAEVHSFVSGRTLIIDTTQTRANAYNDKLKVSAIEGEFLELVEHKKDEPNRNKRFDSSTTCLLIFFGNFTCTYTC